MLCEIRHGLFSMQMVLPGRMTPCWWGIFLLGKVSIDIPRSSMYKEVAAAIHRRQITGGGDHQMFFCEVFGNHVIWQSYINYEEAEVEVVNDELLRKPDNKRCQVPCTVPCCQPGCGTLRDVGWAVSL